MDKKYEKLLDSEMLEFVRKTESLYSSNAIEMTILEHRTQYNYMAKYFQSARPPELLVEDVVLSDVPVRIYSSKKLSSLVIIYLHGGGFMLGGLDSHDDVCAEIAFNTKTKVISVDYALFPENSFFDAIDDCIKVINSLPQSSSIILAGDSAGGTLAANLSSYFASKRGIKVVGQVLIYPGLGGDGKSGSYKRHSNAPLLSQKETNFYRDQIFNSLGKERVPSGLVLKDGDFTNLPTTIVFSAEFDPLCDDGANYCGRIREEGGNAEWHLELGLVHGYLRARHISQKASKSFERILASIKMISEIN